MTSFFKLVKSYEELEKARNAEGRKCPKCRERKMYLDPTLFEWKAEEEKEL